MTISDSCLLLDLGLNDITIGFHALGGLLGYKFPSWSTYEVRHIRFKRLTGQLP